MILKRYSLNDAAVDHKTDSTTRLTDVELYGLVALLGYKCREKTKRRLFYAIKFNNNCYSIFDRLTIRPEMSYCAGQDYTAELRTIRELLLKG